MNIFKRIASMISARCDESNYFGAWIFKPLPSDHPFQRAAKIHDYWFDEAEKGNCPLPLAQRDSDLFWQCTLLARAEPDPERQCDLLMTICRYWPVAREYGRFLWDGKK